MRFPQHSILAIGFCHVLTIQSVYCAALPQLERRATTTVLPASVLPDGQPQAATTTIVPVSVIPDGQPQNPATTTTVAAHPTASCASSRSKISPRIFILSLFTPEAAVWWNIPEFNILAQNITIPGLSPRFPAAHCTADGLICQIVTGEGEINAASSASALWSSGYFDLTTTYFLIAGIAGINPKQGTLGDVTIQRFAVQVALQYEIDIRQLGANYSTPYIPYGTTEPAPAKYPQAVYGTEVFELNEKLRDRAVSLASKATLNDSTSAMAYRALYQYPAAKMTPSVRACDGATSDVYYSGSILADGFEAFMTLLTNGSSIYCTTAQEDNAILESLMRGAKSGSLDYSRIILIRTAANFDREHPGETVTDHFFYDIAGGFLPSVLNIYNAGIKIVEDIVLTNNWNTIYLPGIPATNYVGDIFGTLGGVPDFGPYPYFGEA